MPGDRVGDFGVGAAVVDRYGEIELQGEGEHLIEPVPLCSVVRTADMLEVEADLAYGNHHLVRGQLPERVDVGRGFLERVVTDAGPHLLEAVGHRDRAPASRQGGPPPGHPSPTPGDPPPARIAALATP